VLSPTILEVTLINTKPPDPAPVDSWDFVDASNQLHTPAPAEFEVTVDDQTVALQAIGFKRRPLYAPLAHRDLRIGNYLYLQLAQELNTNGPPQRIEVKNPDARLWPAGQTLILTNTPLRQSPAIHVNQVGYVPAFPKKARVGYYLGSLGEMAVPAPQSFQIVDANSGAQVYQGTLTNRPDVGYLYTPTPYQRVYEADFSSVTNPGEYRLTVSGMGASLPFRIDEGVAMNFARTYALGLYHQRCGTSNALPFTRFTHDTCHYGPADIPGSRTNFAAAWRTISIYADTVNPDNPPQIAPRLTNETAQLFPFANQGKLDVRGGHHDAGDYSKYTVNSAQFVHYLVFAVDAFPGVASLDNLGIPESGDGVSDLLQEAKWEADYLARIQDADGGFYFLLYPRNREYENNVLPEHGDPQVVWPKNTSATAAAVAALAQCASSPQFKQQFPAAAARYLQQAQRGWRFLTNAIARFGKDGAYQKLTSYGDEFRHDDELAWAACELFLATGDPVFHEQLKAWFDPNDQDTWRWGWWRMYRGYGCATRSYAFAARKGLVQASQLDAVYLAACQTQIVAAANDVLNRAQQNAYGSSFPLETKRVFSAGWYFSSAQAFDLTVAYQLDPRPEWLEAILSNLNYEAGGNPVNVCYVTGLGWKRQREIVHQYAQNDRRVLPPTGIPLGNIQSGFPFLDNYGGELPALSFPPDGGDVAVPYPPYPFYDRWGDTYNVTTEFVILDQARSLASLSYLAAQTSLRTQSWHAVTANIVGLPARVSDNLPVTASLQVTNLDLTGACILWEARDQQPVYGTNFTFAPTNAGAQWVEAEVLLPDGRRVFAAASFVTTNDLPTVSVVARAFKMSEEVFQPGVFTFTRTGSTAAPLTVSFGFGGTATKWNDYRRLEGDVPTAVTFPAGAASTTLTLYPVADGEVEDTETILLTLAPGADYNLGSPDSATITIADRVRILSVVATAEGANVLTWTTAPGYLYQVLGKDHAGDPDWTDLSDTIFAKGEAASWTDASAATAPQRQYLIRVEIPDGVQAVDHVGSVGIVEIHGGGMLLTWTSEPVKTYRVAYKSSLPDGNWTDLSSDITATSTTTSWPDYSAADVSHRFYVVRVVE